MTLSIINDRVEIENFFKKVSETERTCNNEVNDAMWYLHSLFEDNLQREFIFVRDYAERFPVEFVISFMIKEEATIPIEGKHGSNPRTFYEWHHHLGFINRLFCDSDGEVLVEVTVQDFSDKIGMHYILDVISLPHRSIQEVFRFLLDSPHLWVKG